MSFGLEVYGQSSSVQISTDYASYECIFSGTVSNAVYLQNVEPTDIIAYTYLHGGLGRFIGGVSAWLNNDGRQHLLTALGVHRILIFRPSSQVVQPKRTFGVEVLGPNGEMYFNGGGLPLIFKEADFTYAALVYQGSGCEAYGDINLGDGQVRFYINTSYVTQSGVFRTARYEANPFYGTWNEPSVDITIPPSIIEVSHIPLYFNLGLASA